MKILFMGIGLVHYYNLVLNRLNQLEGFEVLNVIPRNSNGHIEEGVFQTSQGVNFRVCLLPEFSVSSLFHSFCGLPSFLRMERPDIIVFTQYYLPMFMFNLPVRLAVKRLKIKLIFKSIPFRLKTYGDCLENIRTSPGAVNISRTLTRPLLKIPWLLRLLRMAGLEYQRLSFQLPDAHVNYIKDACRIYGSYGVPRERLFVTYNSPDTDHLFQVRLKIEKEPPILPPSNCRLVHVGRLVPSKKTGMLIRAFADVKSRFHDAELLVIGDGPEHSRLWTLAQDLKISASVKFLGGIYDPLVLGKYLKASTAYVLAGMGGLSINDAMIFGLPVICSVCDGTEKVLVRDGVNGLLFEDGNRDDLVKKILSILDDPLVARRMGDRSTEIIREEINIHTVLKGYLDAFTYVMEKHSSGR